ncbi:protein phosphatase CheZ [Sedimenticola thiotaurini]|uniref:Protein phosphatase CheZ n=1 Tax=Sedimenticola thiotaurini TaxID=1543721 RepID=A0A0F7JZ91_9GAMM|nr:protein phosphatase CheZ [Sedimenticola thiotaurini]AKH20185.1 chemotaxis protein CheZ [Sedimenticola thiotaurini]
MDIDERLMLAKQLVAHLEAGNEAEAIHVSSQLTEGIESKLFLEVGRLTRELHEAINEFLLDPRINEMAQVDIPDASERLTYVISMTEKSANTTLGAVEASLPLAAELGSRASEISEQWERFRKRELSVDDFRELSRELAEFLNLTSERSKQLHAHMTDVLMAQDFQDLTGQIIRQVITLVHDVEDKLVQLVRISGSKLPEKQKDADKLEGPSVPGIDQGDLVNGQDDVDDLLSSLGF